jgi:hypothetical protein
MNEHEMQLMVSTMSDEEKAVLRVLLKSGFKPIRVSTSKTTHMGTILDVFRLFPWPGRPMLPILSQVWFDGDVIRTSDLCAHLSMPSMADLALGPYGTIEWKQLRAFKRGNITGGQATRLCLDTGVIIHLEPLEGPNALPVVPEIDNPAWFGRLTAEQLRDICALAPNALTGSKRPMLNGLNIEVSGDSVKVTAVDGVRLGHVEVDAEGVGKATISMPAKYAKLLGHIGRHGGADVSIQQYSKYADGGVIEFKTQVATLTICCVLGKDLSPTYRKIINSAVNATPMWAGPVGVNFLKQVAKECPVNCGRNKLVRITGAPGSLVFDTQAGHQWRTEDRAFFGEAKAGVNAAKLGSLAQTSGADVVFVRVTAADKPILLEDGTGTWLGVIMPMHLVDQLWHKEA